MFESDCLIFRGDGIDRALAHYRLALPKVTCNWKKCLDPSGLPAYCGICGMHFDLEDLARNLHDPASHNTNSSGSRTGPGYGRDNGTLHSPLSEV
ncbi:hypothetical protein K445DRAFT_315342 [Daldinia sp. EC12]|nr:hypothetical protein K445DRAFT_315342 [Daldinia sp. EC12]